MASGYGKQGTQEAMNGMYVVEPVCVSQDAYDKLTETEKAASLRASGGNYGGGRNIGDTVGSLCARDSKGVGNQYVAEGKCIIQSL